MFSIIAAASASSLFSDTSLKVNPKDLILELVKVVSVNGLTAIPALRPAAPVTDDNGAPVTESMRAPLAAN